MDIDKRIGVERLGWEYIDRLHWKKDGQYMCDGTTFEPSTNISDAWLVVERMRELGYFFWIETLAQDCGNYRVTFAITKDEYKTHSAISDTAPLAICNAALQALSEKKDV